MKYRPTWLMQILLIREMCGTKNCVLHTDRQSETQDHNTVTIKIFVSFS